MARKRADNAGPTHVNIGGKHITPDLLIVMPGEAFTPSAMCMKHRDKFGRIEAYQESRPDVEIPTAERRMEN